MQYVHQIGQNLADSRAQTEQVLIVKGENATVLGSRCFCDSRNLEETVNAANRIQTALHDQNHIWRCSDKRFRSDWGKSVDTGCGAAIDTTGIRDECVRS